MRESLKDFIYDYIEQFTPNGKRRHTRQRAKLFLMAKETQMEQWAETLFLQTLGTLQPMIDNKKPMIQKDEVYRKLYRNVLLKEDNVLYHIIDIRKEEIDPDPEAEFQIENTDNFSVVARITNTRTENDNEGQKKETSIEYVNISSADPRFISVIVDKQSTAKEVDYRLPFSNPEEINEFLFLIDDAFSTWKSRPLTMVDQASILLKMDQELRLIHGHNAIRTHQQQSLI